MADTSSPTRTDDTAGSGRVTIGGYSHLAIAVTDVDAARRFYVELLGFTELPRPDFGVSGAWLRVGDLQLHLVETDTMPVPGPGFPHFALHVPTDTWEATMAALEAAGVPFLGRPARREDFGRPVWAAFVTDPAGNVVELTDVGPLA
jgi:catechol 2,3-dioxygenase-like lactoylglutathione lyase family enzyme